MQGRFWLGFVVGFLVGVIVTGVAILLFFVPVRSTTVPAGSSNVPVGIEAPRVAGLGAAGAWG